jgi:hypothetical protein
MNVAVVARKKRMRDLLRFDLWDWLGQLIGLVLLGLVFVDIAPVWLLAVAAALTLRPFVRWGFRIAGRLLIDE